MSRRPAGPRRAGPGRSYLVETRVLGAAAAVAALAGVLSDADGDFWARHALWAGLVSGILVIMLSAGIFNEVVDRRRRGRWSVLAQHVMFELVANARMFWTGLAELADVLISEATMPSPHPGGPGGIDAQRLDDALTAVLADEPRRAQLQDVVAGLVPRNDELLGRWAAVMLSADVYAEVIDRHVEFAENVAFVSSLLDLAHPPDATHRYRLARASIADVVTARANSASSEDFHGDRAIVGLLVRTIRLAEQLDRDTFDLALTLVPPEWWLSQVTAHPPRRTVTG